MSKDIGRHDMSSICFFCPPVMSDHADTEAARTLHLLRHGQASHNVALAAGEVPTGESRQKKTVLFDWSILETASGLTVG